MDNIYMSYDVNQAKGRRNRKVSDEGLYLYGGCTDKGLNEEILQVLIFGNCPLICKNIITTGKAP